MATVDVLLAKVVASTSTWIENQFESPLHRAGVSKVVLDELKATYEEIGRLPADVPSATSTAAKQEAVRLWTRIWAEFECLRVAGGYTTDTSGCDSKRLFPDTITITGKVVDLLSPYSDLSSAEWMIDLG